VGSPASIEQLYWKPDGACPAQRSLTPDVEFAGTKDQTRRAAAGMAKWGSTSQKPARPRPDLQSRTVTESAPNLKGQDLADLSPLTQIYVAYRLLALAIGSVPLDRTELEPDLLDAAQFAWGILEDELIKHDPA